MATNNNACNIFFFFKCPSGGKKKILHHLIGAFAWRARGKRHTRLYTLRPLRDFLLHSLKARSGGGFAARSSSHPRPRAQKNAPYKKGRFQIRTKKDILCVACRGAHFCRFRVRKGPCTAKNVGLRANFDGSLKTLDKRFSSGGFVVD